MSNEDTMITTKFMDNRPLFEIDHDKCAVCKNKLKDTEAVICDKCYKREYEREEHQRDNMTDEEIEEQLAKLEDWDISWRFRK